MACWPKKVAMAKGWKAAPPPPATNLTQFDFIFLSSDLTRSDIKFTWGDPTSLIWFKGFPDFPALEGTIFRMKENAVGRSTIQTLLDIHPSTLARFTPQLQLQLICSSSLISAMAPALSTNQCLEKTKTWTTAWHPTVNHRSINKWQNLLDNCFPFCMPSNSLQFLLYHSKILIIALPKSAVEIPKILVESHSHGKFR